MEGAGSTSLGAPRVKQEPGYTVDLCIKIEAEVDEKPEPGKAEPACVQPWPEQQETWKGGGLYPDHEHKHHLVLGPELLQRSCADKWPATQPSGAGTGTAISSADEDTKSQLITSTDLQHSLAVTVETYMCDSCAQLFKKKHSLIRHIKAHLRANPKMVPRHSSKKVFSCEICHRQFFQSGHFNRHIRTHTGAKPHACNICKQRFARVECLNVHKRIHTGQKPYSCTFCEKKFTQSHNLTRHIRTHTGEKPYVCDICSKRCTQSGDLKTHKRIHEIAETYSCNLCTKMFKKKLALDKHIRNHRRKNARD